MNNTQNQKDIRFRKLEETQNLPVASTQKNPTQTVSQEIEKKPVERTTITVDARLSKAITVLLMLTESGKKKTAKETFVGNILKKELKKRLKEFDLNLLETMGVDIEFFDLKND